MLCVRRRAGSVGCCAIAPSVRRAAARVWLVDATRYELGICLWDFTATPWTLGSSCDWLGAAACDAASARRCQSALRAGGLLVADRHARAVHAVELPRQRRGDGRKSEQLHEAPFHQQPARQLCRGALPRRSRWVGREQVRSRLSERPERRRGQRQRQRQLGSVLAGFRALDRYNVEEVRVALPVAPLWLLRAVRRPEPLRRKIDGAIVSLRGQRQVSGHGVQVEQQRGGAEGAPPVAREEIAAAHAPGGLGVLGGTSPANERTVLRACGLTVRLGGRAPAYQSSSGM